MLLNSDRIITTVNRFKSLGSIPELDWANGKEMYFCCEKATLQNFGLYLDVVFTFKTIFRHVVRLGLSFKIRNGSWSQNITVRRLCSGLVAVAGWNSQKLFSGNIFCWSAGPPLSVSRSVHGSLPAGIPLLGNLSLDWGFQQRLGKSLGTEISRDFFVKLHFLG